MDSIYMTHFLQDLVHGSSYLLYRLLCGCIFFSSLTHSHRCLSVCNSSLLDGSTWLLEFTTKYLLGQLKRTNWVLNIQSRSQLFLCQKLHFRRWDEFPYTGAADLCFHSFAER